MVDSKEAPFVPNEQQQAAIKEIQSYAREFEFRYAAVARALKDNPEIEQKNPNKIMEFMAIPNPVDTSKDPHLKNAFRKALKEIQGEIDLGVHNKTIEEMKEKFLSTVTATPKKSKMEGADLSLPDGAKEVTDKTHKQQDLEPAIVFAAAQQILGDTFKLPVKDIGDTETPDGNKHYIEAIRHSKYPSSMR